jgi:uncharacterized membrane protein YphA (DoxX/SURF4 family)/peroxiredoxin
VPSALLAVRLVLAAVFATTGLAKLGDRGGTRTAFAEFGVPRGLVPSLAVLVPVSELAVAASLLIDPAARVGAAGALILLAAFSIAIAFNLSRGRTPDCHCFGQVHSAPIGAGSLVRNAVLGALSAALLAGGAGGGLGAAVAWLGDLSAGARLALAATVVVVLALAVQGWLLLQLLHQQGRLLLRIEALEGSPGLGEGLEVGTPAPEFSLTAVSGGTLGLRGLLGRDRAVLALFVSPTCGPCNALLPDLAHWQREHAGLMTVAILARGDESENRLHAGRHGLDQVLLDPDGDVALAYRALPTPSAVLIGADGRVRSRVAAGADAIRGLVVRVLDDRGELGGRAVPSPPRHGDELAQPLEV